MVLYPVHVKAVDGDGECESVDVETWPTWLSLALKAAGVGRDLWWKGGATRSEKDGDIRIGPTLKGGNWPRRRPSRHQILDALCATLIRNLIGSSSKALSFTSEL